MFKSIFSIKLCILTALFFCCPTAGQSQDEKNPGAPTEQTKNEEEVLKINTDLIQTGVSVFNKKGEFVDNLRQEDFELLVAGKPVPISFFERNTVPSKNVETPKQNPTKSEISNEWILKSPKKGRNIIFVVDDLHLSFESTNRTKKLILKYIEREMLPNDIVAIVSPSGKIGFLQQFTDNKTVLRTAVERLVYTRNKSAGNILRPLMKEYEAQLIDRYDPEVTDIFANAIIADAPGTTLDSARQQARSMARTILTQAAIVSRGTYSTLEQAVRNSSGLPGRKIVFFISDGFLLDPTNSDSSYRLRRITDAAARTNAVIYSFDAKGLEAGFPEGTTSSSPRNAFRVQSGERFELQDGLSELADSTGGKFIKNTNNLQTGLSNSLEEASQHYLIAWEPILEENKPEKLIKIEVRIKNRLELEVRTQSGYLKANLKTTVAKENKKNKNSQTVLSVPEQQLNEAVNAQIPVRSLSASLAVNYLDVPNEGALLIAAVKVNSEAVGFNREGEKAKAGLDLLGIIYDADGKRAGFFRKLLTIDAPISALSENEREDIYFNYRTNLKPGLYQMRVAARDVNSGRVGSAIQWFEIPDLLSHRLALSSLLISEQTVGGKTNQGDNVIDIGQMKLPIIVNYSFARTSLLRYVLFIYNANPGKTENRQPEITVQTQILRSSRVLVTSPARLVSSEGQDRMRLAYAAEISLNLLASGVYELVVTVQDRNAKTGSEQRISFEIK